MPKKKKLGRPKLDPSERQGYVITVRVNAGELICIRDAIKRTRPKVRRSDWYRNALLAAARAGNVPESSVKGA